MIIRNTKHVLKKQNDRAYVDRRLLQLVEVIAWTLTSNSQLLHGLILYFDLAISIKIKHKQPTFTIFLFPQWR